MTEAETTADPSDFKSPDGRPQPVNARGDYLPRELFRSWLEGQSNIGSLEDLVRPVITGARRPGADVAALAEATLEACYGAYVFHYADEATLVRSRESSLKRKRPRLQQSLRFIEQVLLDHAEQADGLTEAVEGALQRRLYPGFMFPAPAEMFLPMFFSVLSEEIEIAFDSADPKLAYIDAAFRHGCLAMGRKVRGVQTRSTRAMLAFNLVFLFRSASMGSSAQEGRSPDGGVPHTPIVATLVNGVLPDGASDVSTTAAWVRNTEKSILRDNPHVRVVAWPTGAE